MGKALDAFNAVAQGVSAATGLLQTLQTVPFWVEWAIGRSVPSQIRAIEETMFIVITAIEECNKLTQEDKDALNEVYDRYDPSVLDFYTSFNVPSIVFSSGLTR